jgi:hypothetical protein
MHRECYFPEKTPCQKKQNYSYDGYFVYSVAVLHIRPRVKFVLQIRVGDKSEIPRDGPHNDQLLQCNPLGKRSGPYKADQSSV